MERKVFMEDLFITGEIPNATKIEWTSSFVVLNRMTQSSSISRNKLLIFTAG